MKKHPGTKYSQGEVRKITRYAKGNFGFFQRLADAMTALSKQRGVAKADQRVWGREHVSRFFTQNLRRRVEPSWGIGILINKAFERVKAEDARADRSDK